MTKTPTRPTIAAELCDYYIYDAEPTSGPSIVQRFNREFLETDQIHSDEIIGRFKSFAPDIIVLLNYQLKARESITQLAKRVAEVGFALFGIASVICGSSSTLAQLIGGRAPQGVGAALIQGNALGYIAKQPATRRLHMSTLMTVAIGMDPILGPPLGGALLEIDGWPWLFLINIPFCLFGFVIAWRGRDGVAKLSDQRINLKEFGAFFLLIVLAAWLFYAINTQAARWQIVASAVLILAVALGFLHYERQQSSPLIPVTSLVTRTGAFISIGAFVFGYITGVFFTTAPVLLIRDLGLTLSIVGIQQRRNMRATAKMPRWRLIGISKTR